MNTLQQQAEALYRELDEARDRSYDLYELEQEYIKLILAFAEQIQAQERQRCAWIAEKYTEWVAHEIAQAIREQDYDG